MEEWGEAEEQATTPEARAAMWGAWAAEAAERGHPAEEELTGAATEPGAVLAAGLEEQPATAGRAWLLEAAGAEGVRSATVAREGTVKSESRGSEHQVEVLRRR